MCDLFVDFDDLPRRSADPEPALMFFATIIDRVADSTSTGMGGFPSEPGRAFVIPQRRYSAT
jgi:hypothetical protein